MRENLIIHNTPKDKIQTTVIENNDDYGDVASNDDIEDFSEKFTPEVVKKNNSDELVPPIHSNKKRAKKFQMKDSEKLRKLTDQ